MVQGDIFSPLCFILAFELIMRRFDDRADQGGVTIGDFVLRRAEYADDGILICADDDEASRRLSAIFQGALKHADMTISAKKTFTVQVKAPEQISPYKEGKLSKMAEDGDFEAYRCEKCSRPFDTYRGLDQHTNGKDKKGKWLCPAKNRGTFEKESIPGAILDVRGRPGERFYKVWWKGCSKKMLPGGQGLTMEPERHIHDMGSTGRKLLAAFWSTKPPGSEDQTFEDELRCEWCCWPMMVVPKHTTTEQGLEKHKDACGEKTRERGQGAHIYRTYAKCKRAKLAKDAGRVVMTGPDGPGEAITNKYNFTYLGYDGQADGDPLYPVEVRIAKANAEFATLSHIWKSSTMSTRLKVQLYSGGVCGCMTWAHEAWKLSTAVAKKIRSWNARKLPKISGRTAEAEYKKPTFDLLTMLRGRRLHWLGLVLRKSWDEPDKQTMASQRKPYPPGHVLEDAPEHETMQDLIDLAHQEEGETWKDYVEQRFGKHPLAGTKEPRQKQDQVPHHLAYGSHWGHTTLLLTTNTLLHSPPKGSVQ